ncbi:Uncharacterised protein [Pragia fontium]|uniref:Cupin fold metalloprotein WbuC cupin domain-containing protein n=1 Tax=Pragia fontium TaxID=82985 RepID=A0ABQ5LIF2_9GAMM|nr:WbuC family cupin fold metalloprotein [Pragia fontium]AKJ41192.1 protein WbuC [Pragia fontium]GKX63393.1 hypothetical protein SOASR032_19620 [Pragia fontium]SUB81402.1 Uncharacterised protein [Pragia fontium]
MKQITTDNLLQLSDTAAHAARLRANVNFHPELNDPVQRLAIAMEPGTYIRPHRHPHTFELLLPLRGRFIVLNYDDEGTVIRRVVLGEECAVLEMPANTWHSVLSLDHQGVIFEVKQGGYQPIAEQDFMSWAPAEGQPGTQQLIAWYGKANVGDRYPG